MYYPNRHDMIETDDIQKVEHVHIAKEGDNLIAHIKAVLDPRKDFQALKEVYLHLTNGINHAVHGPFEHANPVNTSTSEESSTTQESTKSPAQSPKSTEMPQEGTETTTEETKESTQPLSTTEE